MGRGSYFPQVSPPFLWLQDYDEKTLAEAICHVQLTQKDMVTLVERQSKGELFIFTQSPTSLTPLALLPTRFPTLVLEPSEAKGRAWIWVPVSHRGWMSLLLWLLGRHGSSRDFSLTWWTLTYHIEMLPTSLPSLCTHHFLFPTPMMPLLLLSFAGVCFLKCCPLLKSLTAPACTGYLLFWLCSPQWLCTACSIQYAQLQLSFQKIVPVCNTNYCSYFSSFCLYLFRKISPSR